MESISTCSSECGEWSWDTETLTKARGFLHQLVSFEYLITFNITMQILSSLHFLTVKLQKKLNDIFAAYEHVSNVQMELEMLKPNREEEFPCGSVKIRPWLMTSFPLPLMYHR